MDREARAGYSPWDRKESDTTVRLTFFHTKTGTRMFIALFIMAKKKKTGNSQNVHQLMDGYRKCGGTFTQLNIWQ